MVHSRPRLRWSLPTIDRSPRQHALNVAAWPRRSTPRLRRRFEERRDVLRHALVDPGKVEFSRNHWARRANGQQISGRVLAPQCLQLARFFPGRGDAVARRASSSRGDSLVPGVIQRPNSDAWRRQSTAQLIWSLNARNAERERHETPDAVAPCRRPSLGRRCRPSIRLRS